MTLYQTTKTLTLLLFACTANAAPATQWTRFEDPNEHAFSLDVPAGWKTEGGLVRRGPVDLSVFLRALSPDGSVMLILGDPAPAYFGTPGLGAGPKARPYLAGQAYARQYLEESLPALCSSAQFISAEDRPEIASGPLAQGTPYARHDAGDATFSCIHNGKPVKAFMVAGTFLYAARMRAMPGSWGVNLLAGFLAPEARVDEVKAIVLHMLQSSRFDPDWNRRQQANVDQATRTLNSITAAQQRAFDSSWLTPKPSSRPCARNTTISTTSRHRPAPSVTGPDTSIAA